MDCLAQTVDSGRSTLCARQSMDCPRSTVCAEHIYLCIYLAACSVCRLNVPENTPIQSITCSARAHWRYWTCWDSKLQESTPEAWATLGTGILLR